ncbi:MAG: DNA polymerase III subunit gamma/tau [Deltaproteobacteria bacterium]
MSYLVLARKWRPKNFDDIISQEFITRSLKNAVSTGKIAHAFIFSGPRGVGKTSTARILAKALNCQHGPTPDPCSACVFCTEISDGKSLDVIEIDAASHTGVNDVREIIENIKYLPASARYKIYIIDEAHMLSQSAFNALLKTLEEPPPHVLFMLATTEAHKIPVTILSRCQRYDFKKVPVDKIRENLSSITDAEGIDAEEETLYTVAQEADGSLRDALSLMDQLVATFGTKISHEEAIRILGVLDKALLKSAIEGILGKNPKSCIETLNLAIEKGINPKRFAEDLLRTLRYAVLIKTCGKEIVADLSDEDKDVIHNLIAGESVETLESLFNMMLEGAESVQRSFYPLPALELTLIKLATLVKTVPIENIINRIESLSGKIGSVPQQAPRFEEPRTDYKKTPESGASSKTNGTENKTEAVQKKPGSSEKSQSELIKFIKSKNAVMGTRLEQAKEIVLEESIFKIVFNRSLHPEYFRKKETLNALKNYLSEFYSGDTEVEIAESESSPGNDTEKGNEKTKENKNRIHDDPAIKDAIEIFGGRVVSVKPKQKE